MEITIIHSNLQLACQKVNAEPHRSFGAGFDHSLTERITHNRNVTDVDRSSSCDQLWYLKVAQSGLNKWRLRAMESVPVIHLVCLERENLQIVRKQQIGGHEPVIQG